MIADKRTVNKKSHPTVTANHHGIPNSRNGFWTSEPGRRPMSPTGSGTPGRTCSPQCTLDAERHHALPGGEQSGSAGKNRTATAYMYIILHIYHTVYIYITHCNSIQAAKLNQHTHSTNNITVLSITLESHSPRAISRRLFHTVSHHRTQVPSKNV